MGSFACDHEGQTKVPKSEVHKGARKGRAGGGEERNNYKDGVLGRTAVDSWRRIR